MCVFIGQEYNSHHLLKYRFGVCLCSMLLSLSNDWSVSYLQPILVAIFVTIAMVKVSKGAN